MGRALCNKVDLARTHPGCRVSPCDTSPVPGLCWWPHLRGAGPSLRVFLARSVLPVPVKLRS